MINLTPAETVAELTRLRDQSAQFQNDLERTALLVLVQDMSAQYGPATATVVLAESDQGPVMTVEAVLDANGKRLDNDDIDDDTMAAWDLPNDSGTWGVFATQVRRSNFGGPAWYIDVQRVIEDRPRADDEDVDEYELFVPDVDDEDDDA